MSYPDETVEDFKRWLKDYDMTLEEFESLPQKTKDLLWATYKVEVAKR